MNKTNTKKLAIAGVFCAVAAVGSLFSFPVFGSKCSPVQHMVNILCAILLGPGYGLGAAFAAALIRNLLGLGSLMAFPGSMFGALVCGVVYAKTKNILRTLIGEVFGTAILGGLCAYPIAIFFMGQSAASLAFYAYLYRWRRDYIRSFDLQFEKIQHSAYHAEISQPIRRKKNVSDYA